MNVRTVMLSGTSTAYAGTTAGLFKSVGGGAWQPVAQGAEVDPKKPTKLNKPVQALYSPLVGKMLAGVASGGVYSSSDDGATWQPPAPGNGMAALRDGLEHRLARSRACCSRPPAAASIARSTTARPGRWPRDGITGTILRVFADEKRPNIYYASGTDGVFRTINGGLTWSNVEGPIGHQLGGGQVRALRAVLRRQRDAPVRGHRRTASTPARPATARCPARSSWRKVDNDGLGNNTIIWTLKSFTTTPGTCWPARSPTAATRSTFIAARQHRQADRHRHGAGRQDAHDHRRPWTGTKTIEFEYQWQRCTNVASPVCTDIAGRDELDLHGRPTPTRRFKLRVGRHRLQRRPDVRPLDGHAATTPASSPPPPARSPAPASANAPSFTVTDQPQPGKFITANQPAVHPGRDARWAYQWERCDANGNSCDPIPGGNVKSYLITDEDVGSKLCPYVTGSNSDGGTTTDCAFKSNIVLAPDPVQTAPTTMSGDAYVGGTLVSGVGGWKSTPARRSRASGSPATRTAAAARRSRAPRARPTSSRPPTRASACACASPPTPTARTTCRTPKEVLHAAERRDHRPAPAAGRPDARSPTPEPEPSRARSPRPQPTPQPTPQPDTVAPVLQSLGAVSAKLKPGAQLKLKRRPDRGRHAVRRPPARPRRPQVRQDLQGRRQEGQEVHRYLEGCELQARCGRVGHRGPAQEEARRR